MNIQQQLKQVRELASAGQFSEAAQNCLQVLRQDPANVLAMELYGELAIDMGKPAEAIVIFQKLLEVTPSHSAAHERLAMMLQETGDFPAALAHAQNALRLNPDSLLSHTVLGNIFLSQRKEEEALEQFARARALAPGDMVVESAYVSALLDTGQFSRASDVLRKLIAAHPGTASLLLSLAATRKWQSGDPDEALIRALLDKSGDLRSNIAADHSQARAAYMALFKLESDLGNIDSAFAHLLKAKAIRKDIAPFDLDSQQRSFSEIKNLFDGEFLARMKGRGSDLEDPIFVVGMPRSGTTLLERVLNTSPNIVPAGELLIASRLQEEACAHFGENQYDADSLRKIPAQAWRKLGEEYVRRAWLRLPAASHFVDKMPDNFQILGFIKLMLPRARIIHISRHPVANCLSIFEQDFAAAHPYSNDLTTLGKTYLLYRDLMDHWRSIFGEDIFEVSYESLVSDMAGTADLLNRKLNLELDLERLDESQQVGSIRTASRWQARQAIHSGSVERWRKLGDNLQPLLEELTPVLASGDLE